MWSKQEVARINCSLKPQRSQNNSIQVARLKMDFLLWVWLITGLAFQFPCFPSGPPPPGLMWNAHLSRLYHGNRWKLKCQLTVQEVHFGTFSRVSACLLDWLQDFSHIHRERVFFLFVFVLPIWAWNRWHNSAHSTVANGTAVGILKAWVLLPQHHHHSTAPQGHQLIMNGASSHSFYFIFF